ncbi:NYN domain-containing protein [Helicobacter pylori]
MKHKKSINLTSYKNFAIIEKYYSTRALFISGPSYPNKKNRIVNHTQKTAIFVDFENLRLDVFEKIGKDKKLFFDYNNNPQKVIDFCNLCVFDSYHERDLLNLYRIFFYTAKPLDNHKKKKDILKFLSTLEHLNHTALRLGKLVKRGDEVVQKQVDMLLGIDMLEIFLKHFVDKVVLIGYDSDMSPALNWLEQMEFEQKLSFLKISSEK